MYQNIHVPEFKQLMSQPDHVILDVRTPGELSEGQIPGHVMINMHDADFRERIAELDQSKAYLVYCRSGGRSAQTCHLMATMGFDRLYNLVGGIGAWNAEG
jgi:rhodanese-related sulfurtransferase